MSGTIIDPEDWTVSSNNLVITIDDGQGTFSFNPTFTYPIFGDSEQIYGFKSPTLKLTFDSFTLLPSIQFSYKEALDLPSTKEGHPDYPVEKLKSFLSSQVFVNAEEEWEKARNEEYKKWISLEDGKLKFSLPGEVVEEYTVAGDKFCIYHTKLNKTDAHEFHSRLQIFVLFFIEAGSYIDATDPLWDLYYIVKIHPDSTPDNLKIPEIISFATTYSYWKFLEDVKKYDADPKNIPQFNRKRISQFVTLPQHQGKNHGGRLYQYLCRKWTSDENVVEITVEDPSEAFDDLRDRSDLSRLDEMKIWQKSETGFDINSLPLDFEWIKKYRSLTKLTRNQFDRVIEMAMLYFLLKQGNKKDDKSPVTTNYRLHVKRRLYNKNKDVLSEMTDAEVREKLAEAYDRLVDDYIRILGKVKLHDGINSDDNGSKKLVAQESSEPDPKKRKIVIADDE